MSHEADDELFAAYQKPLARITELAAETSTEDWDGEGGQPIDARQWDHVRSIVSRGVRGVLGVPAPFVSACGDGTAHLQWTTTLGDRGVLEVGRQGYWWSFVPMSDRDGDDEIVWLRTPDDALEKIHALFG